MDYRCISPTRAGCSSDRDCPSTENCVNGDCVHPCDNPSACGINAQCDVYQHDKTCTCPEGFTGNAKVECVRVPNTCLSNQGCPGGMICPDGICMLACQSDNDCAGNERCAQGKFLAKYRISHRKFSDSLPPLKAFKNPLLPKNLIRLA